MRCLLALRTPSCNGKGLVEDGDTWPYIPSRELADNVRAWVAAMIQNEAFDQEDQKFNLEATVQVFESKTDSWEELWKPSWMESFGRHGFKRRFKMLQLLRLVVLVKDVRTAKLRPLPLQGCVAPSDWAACGFMPVF